ncbi:TonB-dependent receptor [Acidicapsa ligni]|uniref:TonB-dependent receptor n=1 Tax=Acidicapsa ligni TaxID=542300 RepID=UPI0021DF9CC0|nr:carboxypeptidase regulatory-like domain-containing protein [Acidicapsa ligni]
MRLRTCISLALLCLATAVPALATVFSSLHGIVHDPQHFPVKDAAITLRAADSDFQLKATTDAEGAFDLNLVPIGIYRIHIEAKGFADVDQPLTVLSGMHTILHFAVAVAGENTTVAVSGTPGTVDAVDSVTPTTLVSRKDIDQTPGASRTIGMQMVTDYVPGAYMSHDMLHIRGGHQTSWLLDGIAIPNTKIASNVGPQIDPKDIEQLQVDRGSYSSDIGDRTYGVFNVLPRNGFEHNRDAELLLSAGNFYTGESQLSFGDHTEKTAYYASLTGSRSNYGLETPVANVKHDSTNSESGFLSVIRNQTPKDQLRFSGQFRQDYFDIPYDPSDTDYEFTSGYYNSFGLRDAQTERDGFVIANWVRTINPKALIEVAPFYHFNQSNYDSLPTDSTVSTTWHQGSNYAGAQVDLRMDVGKRNSFSGGLYSFYQNENDLFGFVVNDGSAMSQPNTTGTQDAGLVEFYISDHLRVNKWITLLGGMRFSIFKGGLSESATYPRIGATVEVPRLHWVFRGFYGHFFQPAPLETVSSSVLNYASNLPSGENTFTPIPSERDEEHQFGVQIPYRGWILDITNVKNRVNNFLDHSNLGESNMYFPIAVDGALVRAWEMTLRSPQLAHLGQFHLAYSNQIAEQRGNIIGGFTCTIADDPACDLGFNYTPVDHDQRHTLNTGFTTQLPLHTWFSSNVYYGSGFSNGLAGANVGPYNGNYLPVHTTFDLSAGRAIGERWNLSASVLNVTNHRVLQDNSVTIGGFHFNDPRMISGQLKYRFHF